MEDNDNDKSVLWFQQNLEDIKQYFSSFLGYGDINRKIWLIGVEEGVAGETKEAAVTEFKDKLNFWLESGKPITLDLRNIPGHNKYFQNAATQPIWNHLLAFIQSYQGKSFDVHHKNYSTLANSANLFELFPLPCSKIKISKKNWPYQRFNNIFPELETKDQYWDYCMTVRDSIFDSFLNLESPKIILFYSGNHRIDWCLKKLGVNFNTLNKEIILRSALDWGIINNTFFGFTSHPNDNCSQDYEFWIKMGAFCQKKFPIIE